MKKLVLIFLVTVFGCSSICGAAEEYFTLSEIRVQSGSGWHETYRDKYGRTKTVDIDIEVFGEEHAPVIKACWGKPKEFRMDGEPTRDAIIEASRKKKNGVSLYPYEAVRGMKVDLDYRYAEEYGNDLTLNEVYGFIEELLQEKGIEQEYVWNRPYEFNVLYSARKGTGEILVPALYHIKLWAKEYELPILTHVGRSFERDISGPIISPRLWFDMRDRNAYSVVGYDFDIDEVLAEDIPLCSIDRVKEGARKMIEDGYIQQVYSLRFGYVVYGNPDEEWGQQRSATDMDIWYLVPSWVMECSILSDPKKDELSEDPYIWEMTINAQTGELIDHFDKSLFGRGDARYKGFVSWEDVQ